MAKVNIKIEGVSYQVESGLTILEAAKACGYEIPSLCAFNHGECSNGSCRVCLVEVKGARGLVASCVYPVNEGMEVIISSPKASEARRASVELLLSNHNINCQQCDKNGKCELLHVAKVISAARMKISVSAMHTPHSILVHCVDVKLAFGLSLTVLQAAWTSIWILHLATTLQTKCHYGLSLTENLPRRMFST